MDGAPRLIELSPQRAVVAALGHWAITTAGTSAGATVGGCGAGAVVTKRAQRESKSARASAARGLVAGCLALSGDAS